MNEDLTEKLYKLQASASEDRKAAIDEIKRLRAKLAEAEAKPAAYLVHNFMIARQPVKVLAKFPEPDHYLYPASRKDDAEATAKTLRADCDPLYTSPVPAITDEAVERAVEAFDKVYDVEFHTNGRVTDNKKSAVHAALLAAFPSKDERE